MLYKAFILALGQDHLVFSNSKIWNCRLILVSEGNFFLTAKRGNLNIVSYYSHSKLKVMSMFEIEATSNKKILKLGEKMSSSEPKAVLLLGANNIYC